MDKNKTFAQIEQEYDQMVQTIENLSSEAVSRQQKRRQVCYPFSMSYVPEGSSLDFLLSHSVTCHRKTLNDTSWQEISRIAAMGLAPFLFNVGDAKTVQLKDGTSIDVRIIGFYHDKDADGRLLPISFETVQTMNDDEVMNEKYTNEGGWEKSFLRARLNGSFFDEMLPDDLKAVIKPCVKFTGTGGKNPVMGQTIDKLFVLSEQEIFGRKVFSMGGEGHWYEWYRQEDNPYGKVKQNGKADWRWERSPYGSNATIFCLVNSNGTANYYGAGSSFGVAFGFCV